MPDKILHKRSYTPGSKPTTSNLDALGEIAINVNDGKAFLHKSGSGIDTIEEFVVTNAINTGSINLSGSIRVTGSINALSVTSSFTGSLTGSLFGTASWATNALTASSADNFLIRNGATFSGSINQSGSFNINGTITATTLIVQTITASTEFLTGSTKFGDATNDTHQFTGSVGISGSLSIVGPTIASGSFTGSFLGNYSGSYTGSYTGSLTGSLLGTASWATNALTASSADSFTIRSGTTISGSINTSGSMVTIGNRTITGSLLVSGSTSLTGSLGILGTVSASSFTGSFIGTYTGSFTGSYTGSLTGSLFGTASWAQSASRAITASYADNANLLDGLDSTVFVLTSSFNAFSSSILSYTASLNAKTSSFATTGSNTFIGNQIVTGSLILSSSAAVELTVIGDQTNTGSLRVTGSMALTGSLNILGIVSASVFSGSLFGTASWAQSASVISSTGNAFIQGGNSFTAQAVLGTNDAQNLAFETNGTIRMTISGSNGNVGIGTTAPSTRLHTAGSTQAAAAAGVARLGFADSSSVALFTNADPLYGTLFGTLSTGIGWVQQQRVDGTATAYNLSLQPNGGNVGVGTINPSTRLHISESNTGTEGFIITNWNNVVTTKIGSDTTSGGGKLSLLTNGSVNNVFISSYTNSYFNGGNIGIGITSPLHKLHISGASATSTITNISNFSGIRLDGSTSATERLGIAYQAGAGGGAAVVFGRGSSFDTNISFYTNPVSTGTAGAMTERAVITADGNVGIGIASPLTKLAVSGSIAAYVADNQGVVSIAVGEGTTGVSGNSIVLESNTTTNSTFLYNNGTSTDFNIGSIGSNSNINISSVKDISLKVGNGGTITAGTTALFITASTANVGIGTISPAVRLEISGSNQELLRLRSAAKGNWIGFTSGSTNLGYIGYGSTANNTMAFMNYQNEGVFIGTNTTIIMTITGSNVGIGTQSPNARLTVAGNGTGIALIGDLYGSGNYTGISLNGTSSATTYNLLSGTSDPNLFINRPVGGHIYFRVGNADQVMISGSLGHVGIGTTTPAYKFVVSNGGANGLELDPGTLIANRNILVNYNRSTSAYTALEIQASTTILGTQGNVGIGTQTPYEKLEVAGAVSATGVSLSDNSQGHATTISVNTGVSYLQAVDWGAEYKPLVVEGKTINLQTGVGSTTPRLSIDVTGSIGIGTTVPASKLDVNGIIVAGNTTTTNGSIIMQDQYTLGHLTNFGTNQSSGGPVLGYCVYPSSSTNVFASSTAIGPIERSAFSMDGSFRWYTGAAQQFASIGASASLSQKMVLDNTGNLGINVSNPTRKLVISSSVEDSHMLIVGTAPGFNIGSSQTTAQYYATVGVATGTSNFLNGTAAGDLIIVNRGTTSGSIIFGAGLSGGRQNVKIDVTGSMSISASLSVGHTIVPSGVRGRIDASNDIVAFSTSDIRFKTNVTPILNALDKITQIGGYEFDWREEHTHHHGFTGHDVGVIAQEIEQILPNIVTTRDSGYKAVKYEKIIPLLIEAIKEQQQQIDELKYLLKNKT